MNDVKLKVDGREYSGWKSLRVGRGIEQIAGTFELSVTERWAGQEQPWPILPGAECVLSINGHDLISGWVDDVVPSYDVTRHGIKVSGRDRTGGLVDCSAIHESGEWKDRTLLQIAKDLATPFGVTVTAEASVGAPFATASIQEGETAFETIERLARFRGVLLVSNGCGGLVITRTSTERIATGLVQGENILSASATLSHRDRYSRYIVKGQNSGSDFSTPAQNASVSAEATDPAISRYRPLVIVAEDQGDVTKLADRAKWEAGVRAGRSCRATITVQGRSHGDGLWHPNRLVSVRDDFLRLDGDMLITSVTFILDEKGSRTELELCRPEAFELQALPEPASGDDPWM